MPIKILFICLGNICRSPTAEGVMNALIEKEDLQNKIICDSAGTIGFHSGEKADSRMSRHALKRGYNLTGRSRTFDPYSDFEEFDYIITMDNKNYSDILSMDRFQKYSGKVRKMVSYCQSHEVDVIPDPYYGGSDGFDVVIDLLEDACQGLLIKARNEN